jgi:hypothetical protein
MSKAEHDHQVADHRRLRSSSSATTPLRPSSGSLFNKRRALRDGWTPLPEAGRLFECVSKLQDAEVFVGAADDLHAYGKAVRGEARRH